MNNTTFQTIVWSDRWYTAFKSRLRQFIQIYPKGQTRILFSYDTRSYDFSLISTIFVRKKLEMQDHACSETKEYITVQYNTLHPFQSCILSYENFHKFSSLYIFDVSFIQNSYHLYKALRKLGVFLFCFFTFLGLVDHAITGSGTC